MTTEQLHKNSKSTFEVQACQRCGGSLRFLPGANSTQCEHCQHINTVEGSNQNIVEVDYDPADINISFEQQVESVQTQHCDACGATCELPPQVVASRCAFCDHPIAQKPISVESVRATYLLPFDVTQESADAVFGTWLKSRWFAPNSLATRAQKQKLDGVYLPFWTFDARTDNQYEGRRGEYYYVTETYTQTVNGRTERRSRQVRKTRWYHAAGQVQLHFDDILVFATKVLPNKLIDALSPWDLSGLMEYQAAYLAGFRAERSLEKPKEGFDKAAIKMKPRIENAVRVDIGGDTQTITALRTRYSEVRHKHVLLPVWLSAYRYRDTVYRIVVNARTGELQGERPYSIFKIVFLALGIITALGLGYCFFEVR